MDWNKIIKWEFIKNNVKDRMIESSLIHRFSKSKKYTESTKLLNKWVQNHKKFSYFKYINMKRSIKKSIWKDVIIKDYDSYGEEDYLIAHTQNLYKSKIKNNRAKISNNKDSFTSTPIRTIQKEKEISFTDSDSSETSIENTILESSIFQDKDDIVVNTKSFSDINNADTVSVVEIKQSVSSPEQYFIPTKKTQFIDNEEKRFVNTTDSSSAIAKKRKTSKKASLSHKRNNSFMNGERTSEEILDLISDEEEITACHSNTSHNNINSFALEAQRSPVIISSTEISNNRYKVINKKECYRYLWNEYNDVSVEEKEKELEENVIFVENTSSSSILPLSDKRVNQNKNLNLVMESSSSEDEVQKHEENLSKEISPNYSNCTATKKITFNKNLFSTVKSSLSKDKIIELKENVNKKSLPNNSTCIADKTNTIGSKNFDLTMESTLSEDELLKGQNLNEKINNSNSVASKKTIQSKLKLKRSSNADHKNDQSISNIQSKNNSINHNDSINHRNDSKNCEQIQRFDGIPCNLQDLINKQNLVHDSTKSTFTLEDLSQDNEIFLLNIPSTIKLTDLKGQQLILKNEKLKLGGNQYRISYKDVPSQSCVFATHKNNKSYKLVNIKPTSSILVREKLSPSSFI
ncbi:putative leucine-rich repeat-containing protein DDB_G0290503 [Polistes fuscatus]|uniref:putative leucine-rich repeat-containing protein DDB_G0290503 n=1 Tax=Polistes fuscatus TaxID=30207 RepID=UPI001CA7C6EA|nr:putative leucine-rich repeat-containing protein DDB_G0290503 [Polistes fuscatus]